MKTFHQESVVDLKDDRGECDGEEEHYELGGISERYSTDAENDKVDVGIYGDASNGDNTYD